MVQHASTSGSPYSFQRSMPNSLKSKRGTKSNKVGLKDKAAVFGQTPRSAPAITVPHPFTRFPWEIVYHVLQIAALDQSNAVALLSLSPHHKDQLQKHVYHSVSLTSLPAIENFAALLRKRPEVGRLVRNLWIGPTTMDSDLLSALAPPEQNESSMTLDARHRANAFTRAILRACRKTEHLALSGGLCSPASTYGYGTACQPKELTCVNPHSFVGGFGAPIFAKTEKIHLIDVSLTTDETDHLIRLPMLTTLIWTSPRDDGDATWDARKIVDLAWQCTGREEPAPQTNLPSSPSYDFNTGDTGPVTDLFLSQPQARTHAGPSKLQRVHVITSSTRREMLRRALNSVDFVRLDDTDPTSAVRGADSFGANAAATPTPPTPPYAVPPYHAQSPPLPLTAAGPNLSSASSSPSMPPVSLPPGIGNLTFPHWGPSSPPSWRSFTPPPNTEPDLLSGIDNMRLEPPLPAQRVTITTSTLPHAVVEEWQALRDDILSLQYRWDGYRPPKKKKLPHPTYPDTDDEDGPVLVEGPEGTRSNEYKTIEDSFTEGSEALEYFHRQWLS